MFFPIFNYRAIALSFVCIRLGGFRIRRHAPCTHGQAKYIVASASDPTNGYKVSNTRKSQSQFANRWISNFENRFFQLNHFNFFRHSLHISFDFHSNCSRRARTHKRSQCCEIASQRKLSLRHAKLIRIYFRIFQRLAATEIG